MVGCRGQARPCASQDHPQAALEAATRKRVPVVRIGSVWPPQSFEGPPSPNTGRTPAERWGVELSPGAMLLPLSPTFYECSGVGAIERCGNVWGAPYSKFLIQ